MFKIINKRKLAPNVYEYAVAAPAVAANALPGQFVILRADETGERVPFTICGTDAESGTVKILVQTVGVSTAKMEKAEYFTDFAGPLGKPTDLTQYKNTALVGGGVGAGLLVPLAGRYPSDVIVGARDGSLLFYTDELRKLSKNLYLTTDDGSRGKKGFVTDALMENIEGGVKYDCVLAVGPLPMMRAVAELTKRYNIACLVSMNPIMIDGTGMCGCCRLSVGGTTLYACVDGPEFDGHLVDFEEAINRNNAYRDIERAHLCRITGGAK